MLGCIIKEEIDIPFNDVDDIMDQHNAYDTIKKESVFDVKIETSYETENPLVVAELTEDKKFVDSKMVTTSKTNIAKDAIALPKHLDFEKKYIETLEEMKTPVIKKEPQRKPKTIINSNDVKRKPNNCIKSRIVARIKQICPDCELIFEGFIHVLQKCLKCRSSCVYQCTNCTKQYETKASIKNHLDTKCYPRRKHSCQKCKYTSTKYAHVKRHVMNVHNATTLKLPSFIQSTKFN